MKKYKIAITTGDKKGIGKEITKKALDILKPNQDDVLIIGEKIDVDYDFLEVNEENNGTFCASGNSRHIAGYITAYLHRL
jgi:4-hydroxy-L-threonine phosphate dehydrogenase PdxA